MSNPVQQTSSAVYSVSVDSRSRKAGEPLWRYSVPLEQHLQFVRSVQVGSWQFPISLDGVPCGSKLAYSEPINIPCGADLVFSCTTTSRPDPAAYNSGNLASTVTTTSDVSCGFLLPPTLNKVTTAVASNATATQFDTENEHGLAAGVAYYPCQLPISIVGGAYPADCSGNAGSAVGNYGPAINSSTVVTPITDVSAFSFQAGVLNALVPVANTHDTRNVGGTDPSYNSFVYSARPTLSELLCTLNRAIAGECAAFDRKPQFSLDDDNCRILLSAPSSEVHQNCGGAPVILKTTYSLDSGGLMSLLGLSPGVLDPPKQAKLSDLCFMRRVCLDRGHRYTGEELADEAEVKMNTLAFAQDASFVLLAPGGTPYTISIVEGRYTGPQMAGALQAQIATTLCSDHYFVSYVADSPGGRFRFTQAQGLPFTLDFSLAATVPSPTAAVSTQLGFDSVKYWGSSTYLSPHLAAQGAICLDASDANFPRNLYGVQANNIRRNLTLYSDAPETVCVNSSIGVFPDASGLQWVTQDASGTGTSLTPGALVVPGGLAPDTTQTGCPQYEVMYACVDSSGGQTDPCDCSGYWTVLVENVWGDSWGGRLTPLQT